MKFVAFLILFNQSFALAAQDLEKPIDNILKQHSIKKRHIGIVVLDNEGKTLYNLNGDQFKIPASLTKIPVAGAILDYFSPNYTFNTNLFIDKKPIDGVLSGNLYIKGDGDPSFTSERMWYLVNEFTRQGIKKVEGDIIVDDYIFNEKYVDPGRSTPRVSRAYDSLTFGLSFNWNSLNVFVKPSELGKQALISIDPHSAHLKVNNKTKTSKKASRVSASFSKGRVTVSGNVGIKSKEKAYYAPITDNLWGGQNLKLFLAQRDISIDGEVKRGKVTKTATLVATSPSATVGELVKMMMKFSNNFISEMLVKHLSLKIGAKRGNIGQGIRAIESHINKNFKNLNANDFIIKSVSGLSHKNSFKPMSLARLLLAYKSLKYNYEFMSALPIGGLDGTLKNRKMSQNIRAKTGQLNNVYGIAGYVGKSDLVFVIIYNGNKYALSFMDKLVGVL